MAVHISSEIIAQILALASASPDVEVCGLLLGDGERVVQLLPAANVAGDPARRFEIDPVVLIAAHRQSRAGGRKLLGHFHSHPSGSVEPSACDAEMAGAEGTLWLIVSSDDYALWRVRNGGLHGRFVREAIIG
jgi:proteasome lid subunit RPN8/RPN11